MHQNNNNNRNNNVNFSSFIFLFILQCCLMKNLWMKTANYTPCTMILKSQNLIIQVLSLPVIQSWDNVLLLMYSQSLWPTFSWIYQDVIPCKWCGTLTNNRYISDGFVPKDTALWFFNIILFIAIITIISIILIILIISFLVFLFLQSNFYWTDPIDALTYLRSCSHGKYFECSFRLKFWAVLTHAPAEIMIFQQ